MAEKGSSAVSKGIGFWGLLTIVFIVLKLTNVVDWPWWNFNPFAASVLIVQVWTMYLLVIVIGVLIFIFRKGKK
jgi:hypothetical protein